MGNQTLTQLLFSRSARAGFPLSSPYGGGRVAADVNAGGGRRMAAGRSVFLIILRVGLLAVFSMDLGTDLGPCGIIFCPFSVTLSTSSALGPPDPQKT